MDDDVYMCIAFHKIDREKAKMIELAVLKMAGASSHTVFYDDPINQPDTHVDEPRR